MSAAETSRITEALGESEAFVTFQERLSRAARVNRPVLIVGERGTGKELAATRLHYLSNRWDRGLVTLNCATLPSTLIEAELFGHEVGAFTGATASRTGRFEVADGGALFLDEIGNIPLEAQEKILRVVEYGTFERVGSSTSIRVDVRIIAATNADLRERVHQGRFKADLLDRLSFEVLVLPPLRDRGDDILLLARHFASRMSFELERSDLPEFTEAAERRLLGYFWPGNVRELKNVVERAVYRSDLPRIDPDQLVFDLFPKSHPPATVGERGLMSTEAQGASGKGPAGEAPLLRADVASRPLKEAIREVELHMLREALTRSRYSQRAAAAGLGLTYDQFRGLYRKYAEELTPVPRDHVFPSGHASTQ